MHFILIKLSGFGVGATISLQSGGGLLYEDWI
jgi:hypothetical protein